MASNGGREGECYSKQFEDGLITIPSAVHLVGGRECSRWNVDSVEEWQDCTTNHEGLLTQTEVKMEGLTRIRND